MGKAATERHASLWAFTISAPQSQRKPGPRLGPPHTQSIVVVVSCGDAAGYGSPDFAFRPSMGYILNGRYFAISRQIIMSDVFCPRCNRFINDLLCATGEGSDWCPYCRDVSDHPLFGAPGWIVGVVLILGVHTVLL